MKQSDILTCINEARHCAMVMFENACYIQNELDNVYLPDSPRKQTEAVVASLIGTKHDVLSELFELNEVFLAEEPISKIYERLQRVVRWFKEDIERMHHLVTVLDAFGRQDPRSQGAFVLIVESAANILNAFDRVLKAVDGLCGIDKP